MKYKRKGNVSLIIMPILFIVFIIIFISLIFIYAQILIDIYDVKNNIYYLVQASISDDDLDNMAYRDYILNENEIKAKLDTLLKSNYISQNIGIVGIRCTNIEVKYLRQSVLEHTNGKYAMPIICVNIKIIFNPLVSLLGKNININLHDDVKISLLEFT